MTKERADIMYEQYPFLEELAPKGEQDVDILALPLEDEVYSYRPDSMKGRLHEQAHLVTEDGKFAKEIVKDGERVSDALKRLGISNGTDCVVLHRVDYFPAAETKDRERRAIYVFDFHLSVGKRALTTIDNKALGEAFEAYFDFRSSENYTGKDKIPIIEDLNSALDLSSLDAENVLDAAQLIVKRNPSKGTFVHYIEMNNLINFSKERPVEAAEALLGLFEEGESLATRIHSFRRRGKEFKKESSFGAPLVAYVMTAFNSQQYTLYKDKPFKSFGKRFGIEIPRLIDEKYAFYISLCRALLRYFRQAHYLEDPIMLDAQDFIYSLMKYDLI